MESSSACSQCCNLPDVRPGVCVALLQKIPAESRVGCAPQHELRAVAIGVTLVRTQGNLSHTSDNHAIPNQKHAIVGTCDTCISVIGVL